MYRMRAQGDDLAAFVRASLDDGEAAAKATPRISAFRSARDWRGQIRRNFGQTKLYQSQGWKKGVLVRQVRPGVWEVRDKATYSKGRTTRVALSWVFDNAPTIQGRKGWVAVPIERAAPVAASGRRYMWPSEAASAGWEIQIVPVMGKRFKVIMARRGPRDEWRACWFYIPPYKAKKGLDLDGIHRRHDARTDEVWGEEFDRLSAKRARKRA